MYIYISTYLSMLPLRNKCASTTHSLLSSKTRRRFDSIKLSAKHQYIIFLLFGIPIISATGCPEKKCCFPRIFTIFPPSP